MKRDQRISCVRLVFEPNRHSSAQIERIYELLKPTVARSTSEERQVHQPPKQHQASKRGGQ